MSRLVIKPDRTDFSFLTTHNKTGLFEKQKKRGPTLELLLFVDTSCIRGQIQSVVLSPKARSSIPPVVYHY